MKMGSLMPENIGFLKAIFMVGDGGKIVYSSWKEVFVNLLVTIIETVILGGLFILYVLFQEGLI